MKRFILSVMVFTIFLTASILWVYAGTSGEMMAYYQGGVIVNNTWEYEVDTKTLYIRARTADYNETGRTSYAEDGAWIEYKDEIEHIILDGAFAKCTGQAFKDYTALKDIRIVENTAQFDPFCFEGCISLESVTVGEGEHIPGYADLRNASKLGSKIFTGTKITKAALGNNCMINGDDIFDIDTAIYAWVGSDAYEYFTEKGFSVTDNTPFDVTVVYDGKEYDYLLDPETTVHFLPIDESLVALYTDAECTEPFTKQGVTDGLVLYGKSVLRVSGATVRESGYHGLRALYEADPGAVMAETGYEIAEMGALAIKQGGIRTVFELDTEGVHRLRVYSEGEYTAVFLNENNGGARSFAYTAVGFGEGEEINIEFSEQKLLFRGYVILRDTVSGKESVYYTGYIKKDLITLCDELLKEKEKELTSEARAFLKQPINAGAAPSYIYTKEELINVLTSISKDPNCFIPGQHLDGGTNTLVNFLDTAYEQTGTYPAFVGFDFNSMLVYDESAKQIVADMKEYISRGGIIAFSYHMENPTGNYLETGLCRGELGGEDKWIELMTPGTALNTRFNEILDIAAVPLKSFDDDGYPVIWRPMHENNGNWFWWCAIQTFEENGTEVERAVSAEVITELWKYVYEYYTETWGLKHLVWAYSPNVTNTSSPKDVLYCYPGDEYVDIAGIDWYTNGNYEISNSYNKIMTTGKIGALTEFGPTQALAADASKGEKQEDIFNCEDELEIIKKMQSEGLTISYVLNWSGRWALTRLGKMDVMMDYEYALDLYDIKDFFDEQYRFRD